MDEWKVTRGSTDKMIELLRIRVLVKTDACIALCIFSCMFLDHMHIP